MNKRFFVAFVAFMNLADCIKIQAETKRMPLQAQMICTPFTGHPVEGVLLCGTHMSTKENV